MSMEKFTIYMIREIGNLTSSTFVYVGRTSNFKRRIFQHKKNCRNRTSKKYKYKLYQYIRQCGGFDNFQFSIIDKADNIDDAKQLERLYYDILKPNGNTCVPNRKWNTYMKSYYEKNPDQYNKHKELMAKKMTCEKCNKTFRKSNLTHHNKTKYHLKHIN